MKTRLVNLSIGSRLAAGFALIGVLLIVAVAAGGLMLDRMKASSDTIINERMPRIAATQTLLSDTNDIAIGLRNIMLSSEGQDRSEQRDNILRTRASMTRTLQFLDRTLDRPKGRALLARIQAEDRLYRDGQDKLMALVAAGEADAARSMLASELRPNLMRLKGAAGELIAFQNTLTSQASAEAAAAYVQSYRITWSLGVAALLLAAVIAWAITRSIVVPVRRALDVANTVASGDLTSRIEVTSKDEMGSLLAALKSMNDSLADTVGSVRSGTESIATAAGEVAAGSQDLSTRTEEQACALEKTASSMEQITSTVRQSAEHARQANALAQDASSTAQRGGKVINEVVTTMEEIRASAGKIGEITGVIDGIAFQTNILALNAAVEAARAGEQGRGFAVVAAEVRNLAQRSAAAAREIKDLIGSSSAKVDDGSALVAAAGDTMAEIEQSVERVTSIIADITTAAVEQSAGIDQINQAIGQMDAVTQQNAALVEQSAAASASMREHAAQLAQAVAVFQLAEPAGIHAAAPRLARPAAPARLRLAA